MQGIIQSNEGTFSIAGHSQSMKTNSRALK